MRGDGRVPDMGTKTDKIAQWEGRVYPQINGRRKREQAKGGSHVFEYEYCVDMKEFG